MDNDNFEFHLGGHDSGQRFYNAVKFLKYLDTLESNKIYGIAKGGKGIFLFTKDEVILKSKIQEIIKQLDIDIERNAKRKLDSIKETGDSIECTLIAYDPEIVKYRLLKLMED